MDYKNLSRHCQPELGNQVSLCGIIDQPRIRWKCDPSKKYTVLLVDVTPYGLAHPKVAQFGVLWLVVDIPGCRLSAGNVISPYQPPTPVYGAGKGVYTFLVYEQPDYKIDWSEEPITSRT